MDLIVGIIGCTCRRYTAILGIALLLAHLSRNTNLDDYAKHIHTDWLDEESIAAVQCMGLFFYCILGGLRWLGKDMVIYFLTQGLDLLTQGLDYLKALTY
jgi:hypothetical protein